MLVKIKKINFSKEMLDAVKTLSPVFETVLGGSSEELMDGLPAEMDVWVDTSKVIAATEVQKFGDLPAAFKIFFDADHSWDVAAESYQEFIDAWTFCNRKLTKPLYS